MITSIAALKIRVARLARVAASLDEAILNCGHCHGMPPFCAPCHMRRKAKVRTLGQLADNEALLQAAEALREHSVRKTIASTQTPKPGESQCPPK